MSTIAHRPHRGMLVSAPVALEIQYGLLGLLAVVAVSVLLSLLPAPSVTATSAPALAARAAQLHPGMTQRDVHNVMGQPSHSLQGRMTHAWTYDTSSAGAQYRLVFQGSRLISTNQLGR